MLKPCRRCRRHPVAAASRLQSVSCHSAIFATLYFKSGQVKSGQTPNPKSQVKPQACKVRPKPEPDSIQAVMPNAPPPDLSHCCCNPRTRNDLVPYYSYFTHNDTKVLPTSLAIMQRALPPPPRCLMASEAENASPFLASCCIDVRVDALR